MNIFDKKIIVCLGPGGVGKTTTSVALALKAAQEGKKCLVMTIDPSRRLSSVLNIDKVSNLEVQVAVPSLVKGQLWGKIIEPETTFKNFVLKFSNDKEQAEKLFKNVLFKQLSSTLKDSQDFTSIEALMTVVENKKYDLIILDTPPIQNLTDFFDAPENMYSLFNSAFFKIIGQTSDSQSLIKKFIGKGAQGALGLLSKVTGKQFVEELIIFFKSIEGLSLQIKNHSHSVNDLLKSKSTGYVLVTEGERSKLIEATDIYDQLSSRGYALELSVLNRCFPTWFNEKDQEKIKPDSKAFPVFNKENTFYSEKEKIIDKFCQQLDENDKVIRIPILKEINSLNDISSLADYLKV